MFVRKDGTVMWFVNNKAQKAFLKLGRDARQLKWTGAYKKGGLSSQERKAVKQAEKMAEEMKKAEAAKAEESRRAEAAKAEKGAQP
jgi:large subunit ribosomal protein L24e